MDVKTEWANAFGAEKARLANIPNAQTQAAMRDADAWVVEMRAKESLCSQSNIGTLVKKASSYSELFAPKI
jgi:hypothetical protein